MQLSSHLLALTIAFTSTHAAISIPRPPAPPSPPRIPTPNHPTVPKPITPGRPPIIVPDPNPGIGVPPQPQVKQNFERIEQKLEIIGTGVEAISAIVEGILQTPQATGDSDNIPATTAVATTTETPIPTTAYNACTTLASHLQACASATNNFYNLPASQQANCACYTTTTSSSSSCGPSAVQSARVTNLAVQAFDVPVKICQGYLDEAGYDKAAEALIGVRNGQAVLGAGFCSSVYVNAQSKNGTGMKEVLGSEGIGNCRSEGTNSSPRVEGGGTRGVGLDGALLVSATALVALVSWVGFV